MEDDPYYFLQEGPYTLPSERTGKSNDLVFNDSDEEYIASLAPSFLSYVQLQTPFSLNSFSSFFIKIWLPRSGDSTGHFFQSKSTDQLLITSLHFNICTTDYCSGMSLGLDYLQPFFRWKDREDGRNLDGCPVWICSGLDLLSHWNCC